MKQPSAGFEAQFSPESMIAASLAFRDYLFKQYGRLLIVACLINAAGLAFVYWSGAERGLAFYSLTLILLVLCPAWLLYKYFVGPRLQAARLQLMMPPRGNVSVNEDFVALPGKDGRDRHFPWSKTKVIEHASLFLLVPSPFFVYYVPKFGMPAVLQELFQAKAARSAA